jgi:hypothetical protein
MKEAGLIYRAFLTIKDKGRLEDVSCAMDELDGRNQGKIGVFAWKRLRPVEVKFIQQGRLSISAFVVIGIVNMSSSSVDRNDDW